MTIIGEKFMRALCINLVSIQYASIESLQIYLADWQGKVFVSLVYCFSESKVIEAYISSAHKIVDHAVT
jgi:hypothetical protein